MNTIIATLLFAVNLVSSAAAFETQSSWLSSYPWLCQTTAARFSYSIPPSDRTVLIKLDTHNYPLWIWDDVSSSYETHYTTPSAVLLNFTLAADNSALLLNGSPYLSFLSQDPTPASIISAYQIPVALTSDKTLNDWKDANVFSHYTTVNKPRLLDLSRVSLVHRQDGHHTVGSHPELDIILDIIGLSTPLPHSDSNTTIAEHSFSDAAPDPEAILSTLSVLDAHTQPFLRLKLSPSTSTDENSKVLSANQRPAAYVFTSFETLDRAASGPVYTYPDTCSLSSWRCAELDQPPWWAIIWRHEYDRYGRVGSLRHAALRRWARPGWIERVLEFGLLAWSVQFVYKFMRGCMARSGYAMVRTEREDFEDDDGEDGDAYVLDERDQEVLGSSAPWAGGKQD